MKKQGRSFQNKLFINISIVIILSISICTGIISYLLYRDTIKQNTVSINHLTETTSTTINDLIDDMDRLALIISTNPEITDAFSKVRFQSDAYSRKRYLAMHITKTLTAITIPSSSNRFRINLYNHKADFITTGIPINKTVLKEHSKYLTYDSWFHNLPINKNNYSISMPQEDYLTTSGKKYISLYREIFHPTIIDHPVGIIEIQCPETLLLQLIDFDAEYSTFVMDEKGHTVSTTSTAPFDEIPDGTIKGSKVLDNGWTLYIVQPKNALYSVIIPLILGTIYISLIIITLTTYVIFIVTKKTTKPLRHLISELKNVTIHNLQVAPLEDSDSNELERLNLAFLQMFDRLKISMDENVKIKSLELRSNLIALQSQMDPHFLYNTLSIIKAMSKENNTEQINNICDYLAQILRYTSSHSQEIVTLETELDHAILYLKLMKIRYEDLFEYTIDVEEGVDLNKQNIVKLSLQPLLENCFHHGFKKVLPIWKISIRCYQTPTHWYLTIEDNGYGITIDQVSGLKEKVAEFMLHPSDSIAELKIGGMGLINTIARLKLHFKENFIFEIIPSNTKGTTIKLGGLYYDELDDSGR